MEFLVFQFVPTVHALDSTEKSLSASSLHPSIRYLCIFTRHMQFYPLFPPCSQTSAIKYFKRKISSGKNCSSVSKLAKNATKGNTENLIYLLFFSSHFCSWTVHPLCQHKHLRSCIVKELIQLKSNQKKSHFTFVTAELFLQSSSPTDFIRDNHLASI